MAIYLPIRWPLFWEEIRRRTRGGRAFIVLLVYTAVLVLLLFIVSVSNEISQNPREWPAFGRTLWTVFLFGQMAVITFISPGLTAGAISSEREQQTLDLVLLTRMNSLSIVLGKFFGAIVQMLLILLAGLPIISVVFMFGGVSPAEVATAYAIILATGIGIASLGFLASCMFTRMAAAVAWAYGFMLLLLAGFPLAVYLLFQLGGFSFNTESEFFIWLMALQPFVAAVSTFIPDSASTHISIWPSVISLTILACLALAECTMLVRRMRGLSRRFVPRSARRPVPAALLAQSVKTQKPM